MKKLRGNTRQHGSSSVYVIAVALSATVLLGGVPGSAQGGILPKNSEERFELAFWGSVKDSKRAEDYQGYLEAYPEGHFAPLAKARTKYLRDEQTPSVEDSDLIEILKGWGYELVLFFSTLMEGVLDLAPDQTPQPATAAVVHTPFKVTPLHAQFETLEYSNVRDRPGTSGGRIEVLPKGSEVTVTGVVEGRNWYRVQLRSGATGYTYGELLQPVIAPGAETATKPELSGP
jgi:hypothetical protein